MDEQQANTEPESDERHGEIQFRIGTTVEIGGCKMRLINVNQGKRRMTFTPVSPNVQLVEKPGAVRVIETAGDARRRSKRENAPQTA